MISLPLTGTRRGVPKVTDEAVAISASGGFPFDQRIAERMAAILAAADEVRELIARADLAGSIAASVLAFDKTAEQIRQLVHPLLPLLPMLRSKNIHRDPELEAVLSQLDLNMSRLADRRSGEQVEKVWNELEITAAPYAIAFYFEIRRLDHLCLIQSIVHPNVRRVGE